MKKTKTKIFGVVSLILILALTLGIIMQTTKSQITTTPVTKPIHAAWITSTGTVYAGTTDSIYRSTDQGQTWSNALKTIPDAVDTSCIFIAGNGYIYYSAVGNSLSSSNAGLWRSTDQGQSWTRVLALSPGECIWGMDSDKYGYLFAGVYTTSSSNSNARIYRSTNNGTSWSSVYYDSAARHIHDISIDKTNNYIYATVGDNMAPWNINYVLRSTNNGSSWSKILTGMTQVVAIEVTPTARLFGSDGIVGAIYRTTNDNTYTQVLNTASNSYCFWIRQNDVANEVYAGFCAAEFGSITAGIYVSANDGQSWTLVESMSAQQGYDGTTASSNFVQGVLYHDVVLGGEVRNGACLITAPQPTPTPTASPTATPTPTPTPTASPTPTSTATPTPSPTPTPTATPEPLDRAIKVAANVTVTQVNYNQANNRLYLSITKSGVNYIEVTISKTTLPTVTSLRVYVNYVQTSYTYNDNGSAWKVTIITT